jgi:hypothetical protein
LGGLKVRQFLGGLKVRQFLGGLKVRQFLGGLKVRQLVWRGDTLCQILRSQISLRMTSKWSFSEVLPKFK